MNLKQLKTKDIIDKIFVGVFTFLLGLGIGASTSFLQPLMRTTFSKFSMKTQGLLKSGYYLPASDFKLYWQVYKDLKEKYADKEKVADDQKFYYGSIKGLVNAVGDHATVFLDPEETKDYQQSLSPQYEGIGASLEDSIQGVVVTGVFDGSPAQKAGLMPNDIIIAVDGKRVLGQKARELVKIIRGEANTKVTLTVLRQVPSVKKLDITITRGQITIPSSRLESVKDGVALVRISRFTDTTYDLWVATTKKVMQEVATGIKSGKIKGIIIDLRGNPGGFLESAVNLAGYFLETGDVVAYMETRQGITDVYKVEGASSDLRVPGSVPIVILVDENTASASEIFSGALQYYKKATLVGTETFGKGTVQRIYSYNDGSSLHITIAHWLLPNKQRLTHEEPVKPDIQVDFDYELKQTKGLDNQLQEAYKVLNNKILKK